MNDDTDETDKVGYRKPPKKNRFKKGTSGNPGGRPKKDRAGSDAASILERICQEEYTVGGRKMTPIEITFRSIANKAMHGDAGAARDLIRLRKELGLHEKNPAPRSGVLVVRGYWKLNHGRRELKRARRSFAARTREVWLRLTAAQRGTTTSSASACRATCYTAHASDQRASDVGFDPDSSDREDRTSVGTSCKRRCYLAPLHRHMRGCSTTNRAGAVCHPARRSPPPMPLSRGCS